jgi:hypothetical protein
MRIVPVLLLAAASVSSQTAPTLSNVRTIFIEKMPNNLDEYVRSEISKRFHGSLTVVLDRDKADAILRGEDLGAQTTGKANVTLVDSTGKVVLWSGTAGDRNALFLDLKHGGQQKIAAHLVGEMKKAMQGH